MSGFKFPPPPPPPPRASANDAQDSYSSQRGGSNNSRGDRGSGRGWAGRGNDSRGGSRGGRGGAQSDGSSRGAFGNAQSNGSARGGRGPTQSSGNSRGGRGNTQSTRGGRGGHGRGDGRANGNAHSRGSHQPRGRDGHQQNVSQGQTQQQPPVQPMIPPPNTLPTGGYANPFLTTQMQYAAPMQPQVDTMALAQAMAFMATPAGMQTMAAFTNMVGGVPAPQLPQAPPLPSHPSHHQPHHSPPQTHFAKQKKHERQVKYNAEVRPQPNRTLQEQKPKPPRAKAIPAPAVPGFGFALPTVPNLKRPATSKVDSKGDQKKRKVHLGLTQCLEPEYESSCSDEDVDVDEEAILASNITNKGLVFEHDGVDISLQTPAEINAWIKDRRRQYPTAKRIAEKAKEQAEKRASELEFLRKVRGDTGKKIRAFRKIPTTRVAPTPVDTKTAEERKASYEKHQAELQRLRNRLHESLAINRAKASESSQTKKAKSASNLQAIDLGLGYSNDEETSSDEDESSELSDSSVVSSSEESSDDSDSDSDSASDSNSNEPPEDTPAKQTIPDIVDPPPPVHSDSDSDSPPEEQPTKFPTPEVIIPPPPPVPAAPAPGSKLCYSWKQYGKCRIRARCQNRHPSKREMMEEEEERKKKNKPKGLFERMVEQEQEKADRLALDAIKYLGRHGFLG